KVHDSECPSGKLRIENMARQGKAVQHGHLLWRRRSPESRNRVEEVAAMNLKQRTFFFVALSVAGLLVIYLGFSNYYVHQQERQFLDGRLETARTVAREFD